MSRLDARWGVTTLVLALFHQLGLSRHNPRGFNVARCTALLLNGVLVVVVGVVVLTLATVGVSSDWSAFCIEGTPDCKYYEVPTFVANSSTPVDCGQNYRYGSRGQKALTISDFALFSALAYESKEGIVRGLQHYHPGWRLTFSRRAGIGDPEASLDWTTFFEFEDPENSTSIIAVRGTSTMLDVLDDMNIWLPAAAMKGFSIIGQLLSFVNPRDAFLMAVPCVDLEWLPEPGGNELAHGDEVAAALDAAFGSEGLGLVCVTGDEAFQAAIRGWRADLLPFAQRLARLPEESKDAIRERGTLNVNNYSRGVDGNRTGFYFHPAFDDPAECLPPGVMPEPTFYTPNLWPDKDLPELRPRCREAAAKLVEVGRRLAAAVDWRCSQVHPHYRPGTLQQLVAPAEKCNHKCRLICYHDYETSEQRDTGLLTILLPGIFLDEKGQKMACPDPEVGLYVKNRKGTIIQIHKPDGVGECLFFQALQIVSGGLYHATEHCVRGPPSHGRGYERVTMAVFLQPHAHEELPLPEGVTMEEVAQRACDGLFRMFLLYQPKNARGINFLHFCQRLSMKSIKSLLMLLGPQVSDAVAEAIARVSALLYSDGLQK
eukprot:symbB.v1.2.033781.t3/scaffold4246.1/size44322/1